MGMNETGKSLFYYMNKSLNISYIEYNGMGAFITCIEGVCQDSSHYWFLFTNGNFANVGASSYYPKPNDNITWEFMSLNESKFSGSNK